MKLEDLTPELKEKVLACKTPEDLIAGSSPIVTPTRHR